MRDGRFSPREFVDSPGVLLLGACREEDHRPDLVVGRTTIVDPKLDRELAGSIAEALTDRMVLTSLDVSEAFDASDGLLMEFLSMLMTGRRLKQVVEQQVRARLREDRATEREVFRYVATAHAVGVALPVEVLETLIPHRDLPPHWLCLTGSTSWLPTTEITGGACTNSAPP